MSDFNIAKFSKEDQDKVAVDLVASGVAYKERLNLPNANDPRYIEMAEASSKPR